MATSDEANHVITYPYIIATSAIQDRFSTHLHEILLSLLSLLACLFLSLSAKNRLGVCNHQVATYTVPAPSVEYKIHALFTDAILRVKNTGVINAKLAKSFIYLVVSVEKISVSTYNFALTGHTRTVIVQYFRITTFLHL
jgi:hypothetical protein